MNLRIKTINGIIEIDIETEALVSDLKKIIDKKGYQSCRHSVNFNECRLLTYRTLRSYDISDNSILDLKFDRRFRFEVYLDFPNRKRAEYLLFPEDTIKHVKNLVQSNGPQRFKPFMIDIFFNGQILDDNGTLRDYDIGHKSIIELVVKNNLSRISTAFKYAFDDFCDLFSF